MTTSMTPSLKVSEIVEMEGRIFIPPYDDAKVIAGQGTIGLEIMEDLYDVDNVIVCPSAAVV